MIGGTGGKKAGNKGEREDRLGQTGEEKVFSVEEGGGKAEVTPATFEITAEELDTVPMEQEAAAGAPEAGTSAWEITGAELDAVQPALVFTAEELDAAGHRLEFTPEELDAVLAGKGGPTVEQGEPPLKPAGFKEKLLATYQQTSGRWRLPAWPALFWPGWFMNALVCVPATTVHLWIWSS